MQARQSRAFQQPLLLEAEGITIIDETFAIFRVIGSTGTKYSVTVSNETSCTCPDYMNRELPCKHIYFILGRVLRQPARIVDRGTGFADEEVLQILQKTGFYVPEPARQAITTKRRSVDEQKECPICIDEISEKQDLIYCETSCGYNFHRSCFERCKTRCCPMCRAALK